MKIFISHSSRDKWAARRILADLEGLGATVFLDEKDIKTGDSIDHEISNNLKDCDELLVLLSPESVKSDWVLIEVGGAKALGKRLVPILFYLGANDIPSPISKHLARDINSIDRYYDEVKDRIKKKLPAPPPQPRRAVQPISAAVVRALKVGDRVRLPLTEQQTVGRPNYLVSWESGMNDYIGEHAIVTKVDSDRTVRIDIDNGEHWWAFEWLRKL